MYYILRRLLCFFTIWLHPSLTTLFLIINSGIISLDLWLVWCYLSRYGVFESFSILDLFKDIVLLKATRSYMEHFYLHSILNLKSFLGDISTSWLLLLYLHILPLLRWKKFIYHKGVYKIFTYFINSVKYYIYIYYKYSMDGLWMYGF